MNREKQLAKNTIIVAMGKIATRFISFFLLPLYTALLTTEEYGTIDLLNTCISLLLPLLFLQIDQALFRFLIDVRDKEKKKKELITTSLMTVLAQTVIFSLIYLVIAQFINNEYQYFLLINLIFAELSNVFLEIARGFGDNGVYSIGSLITGAVTVILNVILIAVFRWGAYGMLTATLFANIFCCIFIFIKERLYKYIDFKAYSKEERKSLWKYSIPLVPNQLSWWVVNASDRIIVTMILGVGLNGVYSSANKISSICITLFGILNMTWQESASMYINDSDHDEYFSKMINFITRVFISLCLGIVAFMPFIFSILIVGKDYAGAYQQIPILLLATIFNILVSLIGSLYVAIKKTKEIAKTSFFAAVINLIVDFALIKFIGLYAASISTLVAYFTMFIYRYYDIQKYMKIKLDTKMLLTSLIAAIFIFICYYSNNTILYVIGALISVLFAFVYNYKVMKKGYQFFMKKMKKVVKIRI